MTQTPAAHAKTIGTLPKKVAAQILLVSTFATFILTCWQLFSEWRDGINSRQNRIDAIETTFVPQLSIAVWDMHDEQINLLMTGIQKGANANFIKIEDHSGFVMTTLGEPDSGDSLERSFRLVARVGKTDKDIGTLQVQTALRPLYDKLLRDLWAILAGQGIKTFLVTFAIMLIVRNAITRHLATIACDVLANRDRLMAPKTIELDRPRHRNNDELDSVVDSVNLLHNSMRDALQKIETQNAERQTLQENLIDATQRASLSQAVTGVLHDVNNFLTVISGYVPVVNELLLNIKADTSPDRFEAIDLIMSKITRATESAVQVAGLNLRTFSLTASATKLPIDSVINAVASIQQGYLAKLRIKLQLTDTAGLECFAMPGVVATILLNLLKNAAEALSQVEYSERERLIQISTVANRNDKYLAISVKDNGPGIPQEMLAKVFDIGFTTKKTGHGIGLHFCQNLAVRSGGNLTASTNNDGVGMTFTLVLPTESAGIKEMSTGPSSS